MKEKLLQDREALLKDKETLNQQLLANAGALNYNDHLLKQLEEKEKVVVVDAAEKDTNKKSKK